ncbi:MAG: pyridoxamine 5'-phosphate oxidase family protein [Thermodesulfobacteriota bacterium]
MNRDSIQRAVALGSELGHVIVATADRGGIPHVAASSRISMEEDGRVGISEWFCPGTLANLQVNPQIAIVVWDPKKDRGYQLVGTSSEVMDVAFMDGLAPEDETQRPLPQVERKILVRVDRIVHFSHAPHSDLDE